MSTPTNRNVLPPVPNACHGFALGFYHRDDPDTNIVNYWYEEGSGHAIAIRRTKENKIEVMDVNQRKWTPLDLFWGTDPIWIARANEPNRKIRHALYERPMKPEKLP